ncbi:MAG: hypothetical protein OSB03_01925 [Vicinamibacterales bacterium]|nr:hypothetical protein [Vicinamibacterales bacterium]
MRVIAAQEADAYMQRVEEEARIVEHQKRENDSIENQRQVDMETYGLARDCTHEDIAAAKAAREAEEQRAYDAYEMVTESSDEYDHPEYKHSDAWHARRKIENDVKAADAERVLAIVGSTPNIRDLDARVGTATQSAKSKARAAAAKAKVAAAVAHVVAAAASTHAFQHPDNAFWGPTPALAVVPADAIRRDAYWADQRKLRTDHFDRIIKATLCCATSLDANEVKALFTGNAADAVASAEGNIPRTEHDGPTVLPLYTAATTPYKGITPPMHHVVEYVRWVRTTQLVRHSNLITVTEQPTTLRVPCCATIAQLHVAAYKWAWKHYTDSFIVGALAALHDGDTAEEELLVSGCTGTDYEMHAAMVTYACVHHEDMYDIGAVCRIAYPFSNRPVAMPLYLLRITSYVVCHALRRAINRNLSMQDVSIPEIVKCGLDQVFPVHLPRFAQLFGHLNPNVHDIARIRADINRVTMAQTTIPYPGADTAHFQPRAKAAPVRTARALGHADAGLSRPPYYALPFPHLGFP